MRGAEGAPLLGIAPLVPIPCPLEGSWPLEVGTGILLLPALAIGSQLYASGIEVPEVGWSKCLQIALQTEVGPTDTPLSIDLGDGVILTLGR